MGHDRDLLFFRRDPVFVDRFADEMKIGAAWMCRAVPQYPPETEGPYAAVASA